jgi:hypothetical protein
MRFLKLVIAFIITSLKEQLANTWISYWVVDSIKLKFAEKFS